MAEGGWIGRYEVVPYYLPAADERHGGRCNFCVTSRWHVVNSSLTSANLNLRGFEIWREEIRNRNRLLDFGGKKFKIEIDSSILAGRNSK